MDKFLLEQILLHPKVFRADFYPFLNTKVEDFFVDLQIKMLSQAAEYGLDFLLKIQNQKLHSLLLAATEVPFWKAYITKKILSTDRPLELLASIPVTSKAPWRNIPLADRTNGRIARRYGMTTSTSGSTGEPFQFYIDTRMKTRQRALLMRSGGISNFRGRNIINIWPTRNPNPLFGDRFFTALSREGLYQQREAIYIAINQTPGVIVHAFPSLLRLVVDFAEVDGVKLSAAAVLLSGEAISAEAKERLQHTFCCPVYGYYACREISLIAGQCSYGRFHINAEDVLVEIVDEQDKAVAPGIMGRVIITGLNSHVAPFIRYHMGDYGSFHTGECSCGNPYPALAFLGRAAEAELIELADGTTIMPYHLTGIFNRRYEAVEQYQVVHTAPGQFEARFIPTSKATERDLQEIAAELKALLKTDQMKLTRCARIGSEGKKVLPFVKQF